MLLRGRKGHILVIHFGSFISSHTGKGGILEDAAVEEFHDVEVGANDLFVLTET